MIIREILIARTLREALSLTADGFLPMAGGTDLVPRIKHGLLSDVRLVVVRALPELRSLRSGGQGLTVGAGTTLADLSRSSVCPSWLRTTCTQVASPRVRELATVGGAILQERRCRYLNRPVHWRTAAGTCFRTGGDRCFVGGDRCSAQQRSLLSTLLVAVGASVRIAREDGDEDVALETLLAQQDEDWRMGGIVRSIAIPAVADRAVAVESIRRRASIDYHDLVVAALRTNTPHELSIAVGAALPYPRRLTLPIPPGDAVRKVAALLPSVQSGRLSASYLRHAAVVLARRAITGVMS